MDTPSSPASLSDAFPLLRPALSSRLVSDQTFARLRSLARHLAPLWWGGFEIDLEPRSSRDAAGGRVDLHQGATGPAEAPTLFDAPIARLSASDFRVWERLRQLSRIWVDSTSSLHRAIARLGLEFDLTGPPEQIPPPAVFWSFTETGVGAVAGPERFTFTTRILDILHESSPSPAAAEGLQVCRAALPEGAAIVHAGTMTSRPGWVLRLNLWGLEPATINPFLNACGSAALAPPLASALAFLDGVIDNAVLALDFCGTGVSVNGLECLPRQRPEGGLEWPPLLESLGDLGCCDEAARAGLLAWPGQVDPGSTSGRWPVPLMIASLLRGPREFSLLRRRLNHIKLSVQPEGSLGCKAYLEFYHTWGRSLSE